MFALRQQFAGPAVKKFSRQRDLRGGWGDRKVTLCVCVCVCLVSLFFRHDSWTEASNGVRTGPSWLQTETSGKEEIFYECPPSAAMSNSTQPDARFRDKDRLDHVSDCTRFWSKFVSFWKIHPVHSSSKFRSGGTNWLQRHLTNLMLYITLWLNNWDSRYKGAVTDNFEQWAPNGGDLYRITDVWAGGESEGERREEKEIKECVWRAGKEEEEVRCNQCNLTSPQCDLPAYQLRSRGSESLVGAVYRPSKMHWLEKKFYRDRRPVGRWPFCQCSSIGTLKNRSPARHIAVLAAN